jgi:putative glutathione S-transferase
MTELAPQVGLLVAFSVTCCCAYGAKLGSSLTTKPGCCGLILQLPLPDPARLDPFPKQSKDGTYQRPTYNFQGTIGSPEFPFEAGRYHLYVGNACPWCHRVLLALVVAGLQGTIRWGPGLAHTFAALPSGCSDRHTAYPAPPLVLLPRKLRDANTQARTHSNCRKLPTLSAQHRPPDLLASCCVILSPHRPAPPCSFSRAVDDPERASRGGWVFDGKDPVFGCSDLR